MKTQNFFSAWFTNDLDEIIFERRNKLYGAYELRKHYPQRLQAAFLITLFFFFSLWLVTEIAATKNKLSEVFTRPPDVIVLDYPLPLDKPEQPAQQKKEVTPTNKKENTVIPLILDSLTRKSENQDTTSDNNPVNDGTSGDGEPSESGANSGGTVTGIGPAGGKGTDSMNLVTDPDKVFKTAEVMPSFPGGQTELVKYLQKHLNCQQFRQSNGKSGKMHLSFVVSSEGKVYDVIVIRDGIGYGCVEEAVRVLQNMPKWIPGMNNDRPVNVKVIIPISMETTGE